MSSHEKATSALARGRHRPSSHRRRQGEGGGGNCRSSVQSRRSMSLIISRSDGLYLPPPVEDTQPREHLCSHASRTQAQQLRDGEADYKHEICVFFGGGCSGGREGNSRPWHVGTSSGKNQSPMFGSLGGAPLLLIQSK